ncbi:MAG: sigma-70 family RNA polymerase sigma factor [Phycisphaerales bacterium]|nr:MAG: sigma-70 family RNA polymerase sigma factor [Phycisphaerales bacterium]
MGVSHEDNLETTTDPVEWVDRHGDALYRFALLRLRDPEQAEDAVQECFTAALAARERFAGDSSERTWLVGILKRKVVDHLRKRIRERPTEPGETEDELADYFNKRGLWQRKPRKWAGGAASLLENHDFWAVFRACLEGLSPRLSEAFTLRELDSMSGEEVCKVLGISSTNLWARLHRARLGLRQCLQNNWFSESR